MLYQYYIYPQNHYNEKLKIFYFCVFLLYFIILKFKVANIISNQY
jgi:hypothetical protein